MKAINLKKIDSISSIKNNILLCKNHYWNKKERLRFEGVLKHCLTLIVLHPVSLLSPFRIIEPFEGPGKVSGDSADSLDT